MSTVAPLPCLPAAVIFDMDGLMLDTEPLAARAWSDAARSCGVPFDDVVTHRMIGRTFVDYYSRLKRSELARYEQAEDKVDFQRREYFSRF